MTGGGGGRVLWGGGGVHLKTLCELKCFTPEKLPLLVRFAWSGALGNPLQGRHLCPLICPAASPDC